MAKKIADLLIKIGADSYEFTKMSAEVRKQLNALGKDLQGFGKSMSLYFTAPLTAAAGASVHLADVQMRAEAKVQQAIKSTGGAAKLNFEQLKKYASELQGKTIFGDEKILNESTAQLLTFTNIAGENFKRVQQAALDVATVLDGDLKSTTIQLGKALNDPVKNLSALSRSGIQFSKEQTTLIKSLVETNKLAEAQSIILDELSRQYGGQAEAAAKIGLGPLGQLKNALGDLGEEIGTILMPMVQQIVGWLQDFVDWLQKLSPATKTTIVAIGGLVAAIGPLSLGLGTVLKMLPLLKAGFAAMLGPVGLVATAIAAVTTAIIGFNAAKKQAFSDAADQLVEKWRDGNYTPEQLSDLQSRKQARVSALKTGIYYDQKSNDYDPKKPERIRQSKEEIAQLEIEIEAIRRLIEIKKQAASAAESTITTTTEENSGTKKATGLIGELQEKITKLEEAKKNATSIYEIRNINLELAKTREELEDLQNVDKRGRIIGNTSGLLQGKITPLQFDPNAINPPAVEWNAAADSFDENAHDLEQRFEESIFDFGTAVQRFLANTAVTIGESIGSLLGGDSTFEDLLATAGALMGQFLKSLGKQLIELGTMMLGIKKALEAAFSNPYAAIAIGIAAVAMGSALISSFNKRANKGIALANGGLAYGPTMALVGDNRGAGSDPEVIAPLSKLRQYGLGRQSIEFIGGQFRLSGSDLLLSIRREDAKVSYINAGV